MNIDTLPDEDLVRRCRRGEADAFSELYDRYRGPILSTAYRIIRDSEEARDAAQEIFLKAYLSLSEWNPDRGRLSTWLYRLAANHAIDRWRILRRRFRTHIAGELDEATFCHVRLSDSTLAPDAVIERKERISQIQHCLSSLSGVQKRSFILRYMCGLRLGEIAAMEGCSLGTVKGSLFRAVRSVRNRLYKRYGGTRGHWNRGEGKAQFQFS